MRWYSVWPKGRQLGARPQRPQHVALAVRCGQFVGDPTRDRGALVRQVADLVGDVVVAEIRQVAAERVGFHSVRAGLEIGAVDGLQHIGTGLVEDLVAALQPAEVVEREICCLQLGAHGAVAHNDALRQRLEQIGVVAGVVGGSHPDKHSRSMENGPVLVSARRPGPGSGRTLIL